MLRRLEGYNGPAREFVTERLYWDIPLLLRQEYRILFQELLRNRAPLLFFDSVGEDRTGIAAGLMSALNSAGTSFMRTTYCQRLIGNLKTKCRIST